MSITKYHKTQWELSKDHCNSRGFSFQGGMASRRGCCIERACSVSTMQVSQPTMQILLSLHSPEAWDALPTHDAGKENSKAWGRQAASLQNPYSFWLVFTALSGPCICLVFLEYLSYCTHIQHPLSWLKQDFLYVFVSSLIITKVTVTTKWGLWRGQLISTSATVAWFWGMSLRGFFY